MGGGPTHLQNEAAQAQMNLTNDVGSAFKSNEAFKEAQQAKVNPFYTQMMNQGNPYYAAQTDALSGNTAQAFAPARQQLERQLGQQGNALPSGFGMQARTDLAANQARAYDQGLSGAQNNNFAARQAGAAGLLGQAQIANPMGYSGQAMQGYGSIMNAPLASPSMLGSMLSGMVGGLTSQPSF